jgi:hypothetical protein
MAQEKRGSSNRRSNSGSSATRPKEKTRSSNRRSNSGSSATRPKGSRAKTAGRPRATNNRSRSRGQTSRIPTRAKRATNQVRSAGKPAGGAAKRAAGATAEKAEVAAKRAAGATAEKAEVAAKKAKGPALAGGAAAAGLAGGFLLGTRKRSRRKVLGIPIARGNGFQSAAGDVLKAAEKVGIAGRQLGTLADEVQRTRQTVERSRKSSPIEVVLHALTNRPQGKRGES